eukprot:Stramenopile-MAST_4_protein_6498
MFARKREFLQLIKKNQSLVLKGGTGIGKTVTVPQWVYDHTFCEEYGELPAKKRVAVLVPRKAIAVGLANYISKVRGVKLGAEIGVGCGDLVSFTDASRLVFMTYGFFKAITIQEQSFKNWDCVILDEAHERNPDADYLLPKMSITCKNRPEFKAIIMSATIDCKQFADTVTKTVLGPAVDLDSVTLPYDKDSGEEYKGTTICPVIV